MQDDELWGAIELPPWDMDQFYACFCAHVAGTATPQQSNTFSLMCMYQVGMKVRAKNWKRTFAQHRIEAEDAAGRVLSRLIEKAPRIISLMKHPCARVLITNVLTTIERELISYVRTKTRKSSPKSHQVAEEYDPADTHGDSPQLDRFAEAMRGCREDICGGDSGLNAVFRHSLKQILRGRGAPRFDEMPTIVKRTINADGHALVTYRLKKAISRYSADLGSNAN